MNRGNPGTATGKAAAYRVVLRVRNETSFGREFTALINEFGGRKVKRGDRAYYVGVSMRQHQTHQT